jgi:hypothetical protein
MKKKLIVIFSYFYFSSFCYATPAYLLDSPRFEKIVLSKNLIAECDAQKGDERGPFGVTYKEGKITNLFLILTGVYYDTCKGLEWKINRLKRKYTKLILLGTEDKPSTEPTEIIWRWRSVRSISGKECISYFANDCE